jgi:hypothetical protein
VRPTRTPRPLLLLASGAVALVIAACGATTTPSPTPVEITAAPTLAPTAVPSEASAPSDPSGPPASEAPASSGGAVLHGTTGTIVNETDGYSITLPDGWLRLDLSATDVASVMESAAGMSEDMAAMMQSQASTLAMSGVDFWAVKTGDVGAGFASNANIIRQPSVGISLDLIEPLSVNQLESMDMLQGRKVGHDRVALPAGDALHLRYEIGAKDASDTDVTATIVQYLIAHGDGQYILTVTGLDGEAVSAAGRAMAESWSFPGS